MLKNLKVPPFTVFGIVRFFKSNNFCLEIRFSHPFGIFWCKIDEILTIMSFYPWLSVWHCLFGFLQKFATFFASVCEARLRLCVWFGFLNSQIVTHFLNSCFSTFSILGLNPRTFHVPSSCSDCLLFETWDSGGIVDSHHIMLDNDYPTTIQPLLCISYNFKSSWDISNFAAILMQINFIHNVNNKLASSSASYLRSGD